MKFVNAKITRLLLSFFGTDDRRINHALEVAFHARRIAMEKNIQHDNEILLASALLHDVGIKPAEEKFGYNNGKLQEEYGPKEAEKLLFSIGMSEEKIKIVKEIIGNHHSLSRFAYAELKILKEADRVVNRAEESECK
ncbi:MAG: HD domain-containing protein [Candidatus Nanoarchaeia archaeon]